MTMVPAVLAATIVYLAVGIGMFHDCPMDTIWDRLAVVFWPVMAALGILWALGRVLWEIASWGFRL